jgi:hypothetical protein
VSAFDEKPPFKKRVITVSLTAEQQAEFNAMKERLHVVTDGALIKRALADLSHEVLPRKESPDE